MISESATGMSNGVRLSSASEEIMKIRNSGNSGTANHSDSWASTMPTIEVAPASITAPAAESTNGSSYAMSCAAARSAPISENLLALDQPAMRMPITETLDMAITKKMPTSRFKANNVSLNGSTTRIAM